MTTADALPMIDVVGRFVHFNGDPGRGHATASLSVPRLAYGDTVVYAVAGEDLDEDGRLLLRVVNPAAPGYTPTGVEILVEVHLDGVAEPLTYTLTPSAEDVVLDLHD